MFEEFQKIPRLNRNCVVTEKIDGTNAQIHITDQGDMLIGSRTRYITSKEDNYGFAKWAETHKDELMLLGPGRHYGEWWGSGVQRGYGLEKGDKRLSLFNTGRWNKETQVAPHPEKCACGSCPSTLTLPRCVDLVPILYSGVFDMRAIDICIEDLRINGSKAAVGFMRPEGVIVYHCASRSSFKATLEKDSEPKGLNRAS